MGYDLQQRFDAFVSGEGSPGAFMQELCVLCEATPDSSWDVLALIDQYYRRGKLSPDVFQAIRYRIERHVLGVRDSDTIPELPEAPLASEAAVGAMCGVAKEIPLETDLGTLRIELFKAHAKVQRYRKRLGLLADFGQRTRSALADTQRELDVARSQAMGQRERLQFKGWRRAPNARASRDRMRPWRPGRSSQAIALVSVLLFVGASPALQDLPSRRQVRNTPLPTAAAVIPPISGPGQISLSADRYLVFPGHASADIQIRRTAGDGGDVSFVWWTQASGAKPGRDYVSRTPRTVLVPDGVESVNLSVPIVANPSRKHTELFYVVIGKPGGGASLGSIRRATVFIMRPD
ncbi:MAG TPA: hypothetical protein VK803_06870 [Steroidobacteraceae bacterium]|jgi:hypothetical protein|nr:hypothetical protein [Steroidobacteraceae bacterium]